MMRASVHPEAGWPFWWRWVAATNVGWFPGIFLGISAARLVPESFPVSRAVLTGAVAAACFGAAQAVSLSAFLPRPARWWGATLLGWSVGVGAARWVLDGLYPGLSPLAESVAVAAMAGTAVGIPQALLLSRHCARWGWWPAISCVGWAALFPGAVPGFGLVWLARSPRGSAPSPPEGEPLEDG